MLGLNAPTHLRSTCEPWACLALWPCAVQKGRGRTSHPFSSASSIDAGGAPGCVLWNGRAASKGWPRASLIIMCSRLSSMAHELKTSLQTASSER